MVNAVLLGGGRPDPRLAGRYQGPSKGLIELCGRPAVAYIIEAARATPAIARIALAGPPELLAHPAAQPADLRLPETGGIVEKLTAAARALGEDRKLLMLCCDSPLLTPEALSEVIQSAADSTVLHPVVAAAAARRDFPHHRWGVIRLREGRIVTTNIILFDPACLLRRPDLAHTVEALRRHPARFVLRWGVGFALRYLLGLLTLDYCERFFSRILGASCRAFVSQRSELAMDLDRPEDIPMIEAALARRPA